MSSAAVLMPISVPPGHYRLSPRQSLNIDNLLWWNTKSFDNFCHTNAALFYGSSMVISPRTNCIKSLSDDTMVVANPAFLRRRRKRQSNHRLQTQPLQPLALKQQSPHAPVQIVHEFFRRVRSVSFIVWENFVERSYGHIKHHRRMVWLHIVN